ncbi:MAG: helix-turn-helix domain-containing protein [Roseiarcus sp.]|jgi:hypothetical protein
MTEHGPINAAETKLLRLKEASILLSPEGHISVSTLRLEIGRQRLPAQKIGKSFYVTPLDLREFIERCRVKPKAPVCGSNLNGGTPLAVSLAAPVGSSETAHANIALASLKSLGQKLTSDSRNT